MRYALLLAMLCACGFGTVTTVRAQAILNDFWIANGEVKALAYDGAGTLYLGGIFTGVGAPSGGGASVDVSSGVAVNPYLEVDGSVFAVASDGAGGWFIGGAFTTVRGHARQNLAHIDAGNEVLPWDPGANDTVRTLLRSDEILYVGGDFTMLGGQTRNFAGALLTGGGSHSWYPVPNGPVLTLRQFSGLIYAGGDFTEIGIASRNRVAALDPTSALAISWNPNANGTVRAVLRSGTAIALGGAFTTVGGQARPYLALVNTTTGAPAPTNPTTDGPVWAIEANASHAFVAGEFTHVGAQVRNRLAAFDLTTYTLDPSWTPDANGVVRALARSGTALYATGAFTTINGADRPHAASIDETSGTVAAFDPRLDGNGYAIGTSGARAFVGGSSLMVNWAPRSGLAAIDVNVASPTYGHPTTFNPGPNGYVADLAYDGGHLYVAGSFNTIASQNRSVLARLNLPSGTADAWNPSPTHISFAVMPSAAGIYAGGFFTSCSNCGPGNATLGRFAAFDASSGLVLGGYSGPFVGPSSVGTIEVDGGTVYLGGTFSDVKGNTRMGLASVTTDTGAPTSWNPMHPDSVPFPPSVYGIVIFGDHVYVGSNLPSYGSISHARLLAFDKESGQPTAWRPGVDGPVEAIHRSNSKLYVGGVFTSIGMLPRSRLGCFSLLSGEATPWNPTLVGYPGAILAVGDRVYVGGTLTSVNGSFRRGITALTDPYDVTGVTQPVGPQRVALRVTPTPTHGSASCSFTLSRDEVVNLVIYDVLGREVARPVGNTVLGAGTHVIDFAARSLRPGVYQVSLRTPTVVASARLVRLE